MLTIDSPKKAIYLYPLKRNPGILVAMCLTLALNKTHPRSNIAGVSTFIDISYFSPCGRIIFISLSTIVLDRTAFVLLN